jgi:ParB family transcriptional regulator, chromosome partitioning protein
MSANKRPKGLGMGLEALLGPGGASITSTPQASTQSGASGQPQAPKDPVSLRVDRLKAGRYQPRTRMDEGSLWELAQSIKSQGVMQPILVRPLASEAAGAAFAAAPAVHYEIIAGERRFRAAQLAGLDEVPVLVKHVSDEAAAVMALIENIQREDLNPLEEAQGLKRLVEEFHLTHEQAAQAVGRSRSAASNLLRLLNLSEPVQRLLMAGDLDMGHARALLSLQGAEQILVANQIVARRLSVRDAERLVNHRATGAELHDGVQSTAGAIGDLSSSSSKRITKSRDVLRLEEQLADTLSASVDIRVKGRSKSSGEVAIAFGSIDELQGLLQKLGVDVNS